jgi:hypothetical protein
MGEDTVEVLMERAGLARADVDTLLASGAAFTEAAPEQTLRRPYIDYAEVIGLRRTAP